MNLVAKGMSAGNQKFEFRPQFAHIHVWEREGGERRGARRGKKEKTILKVGMNDL